MSNDHTVSICLSANTSKVTGFLNDSKNSNGSLFHSNISVDGIWRGQIKNLEATQKSLNKNLEEIKKNLNVKKLSAHISFCPSTLKSLITSGSVVLTKADGDVTQRDIERILSEIERKNTKVNQKILFIEPIRFYLDDELIEGRPEGLKGGKLGCDALVVVTSLQHIKDVETLMGNLKIEIIDLLPDAVSASNIALSDRDIYAGCALINIGNDMTSMTVYNNGALVHVATYPIGSADITNDMALFFQIDLDEAENLKNGTFVGNFPQRKIDDIVFARLEDIFRIANKDLKNLNLEGLLPAGVNLTGEGALINGAEEIAKKILKVPVRIASAKNIDPSVKLKDVSWFANYGFLNSKNPKKEFKNEANWIREAKSSFKNIFKQLIP